MKIESIRLRRVSDIPGNLDIELVIDQQGKAHRIVSRFPAAEIGVADIKVQAMLTKLQGVSLSTKEAPLIVGLDGGTYTLSLKGGGNEASFTWWCDPPEEWAALANVAERLEGLCPNEWDMLYPPKQGGSA